MSIKSVWNKLFGSKKPELEQVIHAMSAQTEAIFAANRKSMLMLQKLGQRGIALMPQVIKAIEFAQNFLPITGNGAARLALVKKILEGIYKLASIQNLKFAEDWAFWAPIINNAVSEMKDRSLLTSTPAK